MIVKYFERLGKVGTCYNSSFITLIPKINDPNTFDNYRIISLIGSLYKMISKVLTIRLKNVISLVIRHAQPTFIKDRNILDGSLIIN